MDELFARVERELGRLDVLVNDAGISYPEPTADLSEERWQRMLDIHLGGTFRCSKRAYPLLARQGGAIVNVSSIAAILGQGKRAAYSAAKGGIAALTRDARDGVGAGQHPRQRRRPGRDRDGDPDGEHRARHARPGRLRRPRSRSAAWASPEEIAETVVLPRGDARRYVTGQVIVVDGGFTVSFAW